MTLSDLESKLNWHNVPKRWYSIDEGLKPDACIIYKNYSIWECFYLDERGNKVDYKQFDNDQDAYDYLWKKMEYQLNIFKIAPRDIKGK